MSTKKKLIVGIAALVAVVLFSVFVVPRNRDASPIEESTTSEETTTMVESSTDEASTGWPEISWPTEPDTHMTDATTAATTHVAQHTTRTTSTPPQASTTTSRPATTRTKTTTRAPVTTTRVAITTTRPTTRASTTTTKPPTTTTRTTTTRPHTTTRSPITTTISPADSLVAYGVDYGKSIGLTYRPQLTQGGQAIPGATQQQIRDRLDQAKAAGAKEFNVWSERSANGIQTIYIARG